MTLYEFGNLLLTIAQKKGCQLLDHLRLSSYCGQELVVVLLWSGFGCELCVPSVESFATLSGKMFAGFLWFLFDYLRLQRKSSTDNPARKCTCACTCKCQMSMYMHMFANMNMSMIKMCFVYVHVNLYVFVYVCVNVFVSVYVHEHVNVNVDVNASVFVFVFVFHEWFCMYVMFFHQM